MMLFCPAPRRPPVAWKRKPTAFFLSNVMLLTDIAPQWDALSSPSEQERKVEV
jgi:hypothetical protein